MAKDMIITTTHQVEGRRILAYHGVVSGEAIPAILRLPESAHGLQAQASGQPIGCPGVIACHAFIPCRRTSRPCRGVV